MLVVKNLPADAGSVRDAGSILGSGRSSGGGHGNPLQYSCLENSTDRGAWQAIYSPRGHKESYTTEQITHDITSAPGCAFLQNLSWIPKPLPMKVKSESEITQSYLTLCNPHGL